MESRKTFNKLVYLTGLKIIIQFILAVVLLYLAPLASMSVEVINFNSKSYFIDVFSNIFSWIYICIVLIIIVSYNVVKMLKKIKAEMDIVYHKSMWLEDSDSSKLTLKELIETNDRIEDMQVRIRKMLESEKKQKEDLAFRVSAATHDVKTPLTVISGNAELLEGSSLTSLQKEYVTDITEASDKLNMYFNLLLNYSKTYYDDGSEWGKCSSRELLESIYQEISFVTKNKAELNFYNEVEGEFSVDINLNSLLRALVNIVRNGIEHSTASDKKIVFKVYIENSKLVFSVWNNGSSFKEEVIEDPGKLFYREDQARNLNDSHYGIGLAFSKRVADLHGGDLELANSNGGAEVKLSIEL